MDHRERVLAALRRDGPDRVPLGIHLAPAKYDEFVRRTGQTDSSAYFDLGYRHVRVARPRALPDMSRYLEGRVPDWPDVSADGFAFEPFRGSTSYFRMGPNRTAMNEWGEYRIYGEDEDYHRKVYPLDTPDCTVADVEAYPFPDLTEAYRYEGIAQEIEELHDRGLAAVLSWEMTVFEKAWRIRGFEELMADLAFNPDLVECLFDQIACRTGFLAKRYAELGVDIVQLGDDVGSQTGMVISPASWRQLLKPRMATIVARIKHANPDTLVFYHTDGGVTPIVPDLIEIGIDILNPVQPECMDIATLKHLYGAHLSFWGGIGVQTTMPFGTEEDVRESVRRLIEAAAGGGGLLVAPAHLIERDIPWENVEALVAAVRDLGRYPV